MGEWLTKLRKPKDASLDNGFEFNRFTVGQDGMESNELFITGIARSDRELHLQRDISVLAGGKNVALRLKGAKCLGDVLARIIWLNDAINCSALCSQIWI